MCFGECMRVEAVLEFKKSGCEFSWSDWSCQYLFFLVTQVGDCSFYHVRTLDFYFPHTLFLPYLLGRCVFLWLKLSCANCVCILLQVCCSYGAADEGHCVWYGQCGTDPTTNKPVNCAYNGTARALDSEGLGYLQDLCPQYVKGKTWSVIF